MISVSFIIMFSEDKNIDIYRTIYELNKSTFHPFLRKEFNDRRIPLFYTITEFSTSFYIQTRRFSNHESRLLSRAHTVAIIVILDLKIYQSMWIHWPFFPKTWTKGHWPLDDLWPHVCWGHMCDSTQGSLCPSPMTIHHCMWIQWSILQNTTYIHVGPTTYILHTTYTYYIQNEWSHSLLLNSVQARQKKLVHIFDEKKMYFPFLNRCNCVCMETVSQKYTEIAYGDTQITNYRGGGVFTFWPKGDVPL